MTFSFTKNRTKTELRTKNLIKCKTVNNYSGGRNLFTYVSQIDVKLNNIPRFDNIGRYKTSSS